MREGRIAELWVTWDNMTILAQLGHLPGGVASGLVDPVLVAQRRRPATASS